MLQQIREVVDGGHRALVFSQFTGFLGLVREHLDAHGVAHAYLDGGTRDRAAVMRRFAEDTVPVKVAALADHEAELFRGVMDEGDAFGSTLDAEHPRASRLSRRTSAPSSPARCPERIRSGTGCPSVPAGRRLAVPSATATIPTTAAKRSSALDSSSSAARSPLRRPAN